MTAYGGVMTSVGPAYVTSGGGGVGVSAYPQVMTNGSSQHNNNR